MQMCPQYLTEISPRVRNSTQLVVLAGKNLLHSTYTVDELTKCDCNNCYHVLITLVE